MVTYSLLLATNVAFSLKVIDRFVFRAIPVLLFAGVVDETTGADLVVNCQPVEVRALNVPPSETALKELASNVTA